MAALLANTDFYFGKKKDSHVSLTARLGKRSLAQVGYNYEWSPGWQTGLSYQFDYDDIDIYKDGRRSLNLTFTHHLVHAGVMRDWNKVQVSAGMEFNNYRYHDLLSIGSVPGVMFKNESLVSYFAGMMFNSLNGRSVPTKGMSWALTYNLYTDNFLQYKDNNPISAFYMQWQGCYSLTKRFAVIPSVHGRLLTGGGDSYTFAVSNLIGGSVAGRYMPQQIPFVGINRAEFAAATLFVAGLQLRQQIVKKQYITVTGNYGRTAGKLNDLFDSPHSQDLAGVGVGYMYNSLFGPFEVQLNWSNRTKKLGWYAGFGFVF